VTLTETLILGYVNKWCRGVRAARSMETVARHLRGMGLAQVTSREVRDAVQSLSLHGWPIGTGSGGVFLCLVGPDFRAGYRNLYCRLREQAKRCEAFKAMARAAMSGQRVFDFAEAERKFQELEQAPLLAALEAQR
jgi:hypothetical protein